MSPLTKIRELSLWSSQLIFILSWEHQQFSGFSVSQKTGEDNSKYNSLLGLPDFCFKKYVYICFLHSHVEPVKKHSEAISLTLGNRI